MLQAAAERPEAAQDQEKNAAGPPQAHRRAGKARRADRRTHEHANNTARKTLRTVVFERQWSQR